MLVGIDASNLRRGGGLTHLRELLRAANPQAHGITAVVVWGGRSTLDLIGERPWIQKRHEPVLDGNRVMRLYWQRFRLPREVAREGCQVLFAPGGRHFGAFHPTVTMCRNMLPFEWRELRRFGWSAYTLRLLLLRWAQTRSFRCSDGMIFLTEYARGVVASVCRIGDLQSTVIPHGVGSQFGDPLAMARRPPDSRFVVLYVSIVNLYKHQWHVVEAVARLRQEGVPIELELIGPAYEPALKKLQRTMKKVDPAGRFVRYHGEVAYEDLPNRYASADVCLFASSCENMPNILLEGMASGRPVACSSRGPMPEVLGNAGLYFDPEDVESIAVALRALHASPQLGLDLARASMQRAQRFSWERCAAETFGFLRAASETTGP